MNASRSPRSDLLLWSDLPDGEIVRAFFDEDRTRRVLLYRRKDGTFSYADQTMLFDRYEQEYWRRGTDNECSFYESEESVLADVAPLTAGMFGFVPVFAPEAILFRAPAQKPSGRKKTVLFLLAAALCAAVFVLLFFTDVLSDLLLCCVLFALCEGALLALFCLLARRRAPAALPVLPDIPAEAIAFLYRKVGLPENGRTFFGADGTERLTVFRREDGCYSVLREVLCIERDEEDIFCFPFYAFWAEASQSLSLYDSEEGALSDLAPQLSKMKEYREKEE